jgi:predicted transcriptional regulator YheO
MPFNRKRRRAGDSSGQQTQSARPAEGAFDEIAEAKLAMLAELVPQLARAIGPNCEVVLHDNRWTRPTIRAIGNSYITGRKTGDLMTRTIVGGVEVHDQSKPIFNYAAKTPDLKQLRVSLLPIKHGGAVIAYISVNYLVHDLLLARQALALLTKTEPHGRVVEQYFSTHDVIGTMIEESLDHRGRPAQLLTRAERIELLRCLKERGALNMRGAVEQIASSLNVSRATIYNYLQEIA